MMRYACFADTPLHVLNCINFVWHNLENSRNNCDLFIHKQFSGYEQMIPGLIESGIFKNVFVCRMPIKRNEGKIWHSTIRMMELFFPNFFIKKWTGGVDAKNKYDILLMPAPLRFTVALYDINRSAKVWFFEDGSVNYYGNIFEAYGPKRKHLIKLIFNKGHETIKPSRIYLNNVSMSKMTIDCKAMSLPKISINDERFMCVIKQVFGENGWTGNERIVYLSQPMEEIVTKGEVKAEEVAKKIISELEHYSSEVIVRPHPREKKGDYGILKTEHDPGLWELLCSTKVKDSTILIGTFSTAQFTPKMLFNKEPFLILTYKLYNMNIPEARKKEMEDFIQRIRLSYSNKDKVINVSSLDEFKCALERMLV